MDGHYKILKLADRGQDFLCYVFEARRPAAERAIVDIRRIYRADYLGTVLAFVSAAFGAFLNPECACFSPVVPKQPGAEGFYESIINKGTICLASFPPDQGGFAKVCCTLVKLLFQQVVKGRQWRSLMV
ncbi:MAG: hypothetical protein L0Z50_23685 [Verrucomicrobiales bacterium]|nr:hypothetical protein [Verrucomicrobiales bacterium]